MAIKIENLSQSSLTLPAGLGGKVLGRFGTATIRRTAAQVQAAFGGRFPNNIRLKVVDDSLIDTIAQDDDYIASVKDKDLNTPPVAPAVDDSYIVGPVPLGAWAGHAGNIAEWNGTAWVFTVPTEGAETRVEDENTRYEYSGAAWIAAAGGSIGGGGAAGQVAYFTAASTLSSDSGLQWDSVFKRLSLVIDDASVTDALTQLVLERRTTGVALDEIGTAISMRTENDNGTIIEAVRANGILRSVIDGAEYGAFDLWLRGDTGTSRNFAPAFRFDRVASGGAALQYWASNDTPSDSIVGQSVFDVISSTPGSESVQYALSGTFGGAGYDLEVITDSQDFGFGLGNVQRHSPVPTLMRHPGGANDTQAPVILVHSGAGVANDGVRLDFAVGSAATPDVIAQIHSVRTATGPNVGDLRFYTDAGASMAQRMSIDAAAVTAGAALASMRMAVLGAGSGSFDGSPALLSLTPDDSSAWAWYVSNADLPGSGAGFFLNVTAGDPRLEIMTPTADTTFVIEDSTGGFQLALALQESGTLGGSGTGIQETNGLLRIGGGLVVVGSTPTLTVTADSPLVTLLHGGGGPFTVDANLAHMPTHRINAASMDIQAGRTVDMGSTLLLTGAPTNVGAGTLTASTGLHLRMPTSTPFAQIIQNTTYSSTEFAGSWIDDNGLFHVVDSSTDNLLAIQLAPDLVNETVAGKTHLGNGGAGSSVFGVEGSDGIVSRTAAVSGANFTVAAVNWAVVLAAAETFTSVGQLRNGGSVDLSAGGITVSDLFGVRAVAPTVIPGAGSTVTRTWAFWSENDARVDTRLAIGIDTFTGAEKLLVNGDTLLDGDATVSGKLTVVGAIDPTALYLDEQGSAPAAVANKGVLYTADVGGVTELFYRDDTNPSIQMTTGGSISTGGGSVTGTGSANRVAYWSSGSAITSDAGMTYDATTDALTLAGYLVSPSVGPAAGQQHSLPAVTSDTVALLAATQTLAAKTLTTPTIASFANATHAHTSAAGGGTLDAAAIASGAFAAARVTAASDGLAVGTNLVLSASGLTTPRTFTFPDATDTVVTLGATQTLAAKTLTTPTIASFTNATHNHQSAAGGGTLDAAAIAAGTLAVARGGTGTGTAFTAGSVVFAGAAGVYSQDNSGLFFDSASNFLGIGRATPTTELDIDGGANTATRIRIRNTAGSSGLLIGQDTSVDFTLFNLETGYLRFATSSTERWRITSTGHFIAGADNVYDIGASGATRPRTVYIGTSIVNTAGTSGAPSYTFSTSTTTGLFSSTAGTIDINNGGTNTWRFQGGATPAFHAVTDNVYDIGASGGNRPKDIYVGNTFRPGIGVVTLPSYTFNGDLDTGMWSSGANVLDFSTGGVQSLRIDSAHSTLLGSTASVAGERLNSTATTNSTRSGWFDYTSTSTDRTATSCLVLRNTSATNNNFTGIVSTNNATTALTGYFMVANDHTNIGHHEWWNANAGALTERMQLTAAGILQPGATGQDLGTTSLRWSLFSDTVDVSGTALLSGALDHDGSTVGFYGTTPAVQGTGGQNLTNNVTSGGTDGTVADFSATVSQATAGTDLVDITTVPAKADVEARLGSIRNDVYQLARALKQDHDQLRAMGILT